MIINRRTFSTLVASAIALPRLAFAQAKTNCAFYSGVGGHWPNVRLSRSPAGFSMRGRIRPEGIYT
jgi:hypothetical protein